MSLRATASQTVGPYFSIGLGPLYRSKVASAEERKSSSRLEVQGRVFDGDGLPVDALLELWVADPTGRYPGPADVGRESAGVVPGFGRIVTDERGAFAFDLEQPGQVPGPGGVLQAPHVFVLIFARGLLMPLRTRMYFPDHPGNGADPVLACVPQARRATLIATQLPARPRALQWDVHLQGERETVCFDF